MNRALGVPIGLVLSAVVATPAPAGAASFPPHLRFRSVANERVTVHYHQGLEALAREAAALAEEILASHEERYRTRVGRVHVVLSDTQDDPNGSASPLPYPLVHVRAVAPDGTDELGNHEGWLRLVLVHELAHVVHIEQARGLVKLGRKVLGRAPYLFPNALTPGWMLEGLATFEETEQTAFGRGRDPDSRMVRRMAALGGDALREDEAVLALDRWPAGQGLYLYGESFLRDLTEHFGAQTIPELARVHAGRPLPYIDERTAAKVTGETFHAHWRRFNRESAAAFEEEAASRAARGLTESTPLTSRGVRQAGPRFSPDGERIAYTSRILTRDRALRVMQADGTGDRRLAVRARARDPDVSPDGRSVVFVRQDAGRSELAVIGIDGKGQRDLTTSPTGTQWSGPRWSPDGTLLAAARWTAGGWLDVVTLDAGTGVVDALTRDRAKDVEPTWTPDGAHVVFRSDRDGASNLYAFRRADRALLRVTNLLGGAFAPDVSPDGTRVAFAAYGARGYDVHVAPLDLDGAPPADPFQDPYGDLRPAPVATPLAERAYRPFPTALPRFWSPYLATVSDQTRFGVATAGADPLLRHVYGVEAHYGEETRRAGVQGFYQYDRLFPTFLFTFEDVTDPESEGELRTRAVTVRASIPLHRAFRSSHSLSLAWRRERQRLTGPGGSDALDLGGLEAAWSLGSARQHPFSVSPVNGWRLRLAYLREDPSLGSDIALSKATADVRAYRRLFGEGDVLALRVGAGTTAGQPAFRRSFAVGGFPDGGLFDVVATNHAVLRGYPDDAFSGRRFMGANLEYRIPLAHPQRGLRTLPVFLRHLHATAFADAAHAWSGEFRLEDVRTGAGIALGADVVLGHGLPVTGMVGVARGFDDGGETRVYFRAGLAF